MRRLRTRRRHAAWLAVGAAAGLAIAAGSARWLQGQEAPGEPIAPMRIEAESAMTAEVLAGFRERTEDPGRPVDWFNLGAGLLLSGDWEGAIEPTQRSLDTDDEDLERSATYNLALARALAGRPAELGGDLSFDERRPLLEQAWDGFRWVLRQDPGSTDARWNLELVGRWLEEEDDPSDQGGGGGGGGGGSSADLSDAPSTRELSAAEAMDLLEVAARQERDVQGRRLERNRSRDPVVEKNW